MEVFLITTGQVFTWTRPLPLAQLRQELASPTLVVVTRTFQILTHTDAKLPSGYHIALIPCTLLVQDPPLSAWDSVPYPAGLSYLQPFDFEAYEDFQGKFRRFPYIEKQLFQLQNAAYETWARYDTNEKHFKCISSAIERRTEACGILVQTALLGFKAVKRNVKEVIERTVRLEEREETGVVRQISGQLHLKLLSMKTVVAKMKAQLLGAQRYAANRGSMLSKKVATLSENPCIGQGRLVLSAFLNVRDQYTQFRLAFEELLDTHKDVPNRSQKASSLLATETHLPSLSQSLSASHQFLTDLDLLTSALTKESETSRQTMRQTLHSVGLGVKVVRIKVEERLQKWGKVVREMEAKGELRRAESIPSEFEEEKRRELERQQQVKEALLASAAALRLKIASEKAGRLAFLTESGSLLPSSLLPYSPNSFPHSIPPGSLLSEAYSATISRLQGYLSRKGAEVRELAYKLHQAKRLNGELRRESESYTLELEGNLDVVSIEQRGMLKHYSSFM